MLIHTIAAQRRRVPVISGTTYPGETLTALGGSGSYQWTKDGASISGATSATYVLGVNDIGGAIRCVRNGVTSSNAITVWHPRDESGVNGVYLANFGLLDASAVAATDGVAVATWQDQSGLGYHATQSTAGNRPLAQLNEVSGNATVQFDGSSDLLSLSGAALDNFRNKSWGYIFAAASDTNRTSGDTFHTIYAASISGATNARLGLFTRNNLAAQFSAISRRLDADTLVNTASASAAGYYVLAAEALFATGNLKLRLDGSQTGTVAYPSGAGNSSDTGSRAASIGNLATGLVSRFPGHIAGVITAAPSAQLTDSARSRIERYLGLLVGKNIALV